MPETDDAGTVIITSYSVKRLAVLFIFHFVRTVYDPFGHTTYETLGL